MRFECIGNRILVCDAVWVAMAQKVVPGLTRGEMVHCPTCAKENDEVYVELNMRGGGKTFIVVRDDLEVDRMFRDYYTAGVTNGIGSLWRPGQGWVDMDLAPTGDEANYAERVLNL